MKRLCGATLGVPVCVLGYRCVGAVGGDFAFGASSPQPGAQPEPLPRGVSLGEGLRHSRVQRPSVSDSERAAPPAAPPLPPLHQWFWGRGLSGELESRARQMHTVGVYQRVRIFRSFSRVRSAVSPANPCAVVFPAESVGRGPLSDSP